MVDKNFIGLSKPDITRFESYLPTAFSSELTLLQKVNKIIQDLNRSFDLSNEMVDYLNRFIEMFDEKLYETLEDVLTVWLEDGRLADIVRVAISEEVIEARTDYLGKKYVDLKERLDSEKAESLSKTNEIESDIEEIATQLTQTVDDILATKNLYPVNVVQKLNANNNGITDVSPTLNGSFVEGESYFFPEGEYLLNSKVNIPENVTLIGNKATILTEGFRLLGSNITIEGFTFKGSKTPNTPAPSALLLDGGKNITIHKNTFDHMRIYANYFHPDNIEGNLRITDNNFMGDFSIFSTSSTPRPITIHSYSGVIFSGNFLDCKVLDEAMVKFQGIFRTGEGGVNYIGEDYTKNAVITNNVFKGVAPTAISLYSGTGEAIISDNIFNLGTATEFAGRIIDGKSTGSDVNTNKIRNITITGNVFKGYIQYGGIRLSGGYGMDWEGYTQVCVISNNVITNYYTGQVGYHIEVTGLHKAIINANTIDQSNLSSNYNQSIGIGGVKSVLISNNIIKEGSILISNTIKNTANNDMIGKIEKVMISNNMIERYRSGGIYFRDVLNAEMVAIVSGNHLMTDQSGTPPTYPVLANNTPLINTLILTGNVGYNSDNLIAGSRPNLVSSTITKLIDIGNTWSI